MMIPVDFDGTNRLFTPPKGWDSEKFGECTNLPVAALPDGEFMSLWKPDDEDRKVIAEGGYVLLSCIGGQYPVSLHTVEKHNAKVRE